MGCDRHSTSTPDKAPASTAGASPRVAVHPTVASLVPSGTDVILGAGMGEHLVAVSNYCRANPAAAGYPTVGDYQTTDWERLTALKPDAALVFMAESRVPQGMRDRFHDVGTKLVVVKVETVADVLNSITQMGELTTETARAAEARRALEARLAEIKARAAKRDTHPRTLILLGEDATGVIGPGGFLDELLTMTGAKNAAATLTGAYPSIDAEKLRQLAPERVVCLMPNASAVQVSAMREHMTSRGYPDATILTEWYLLQPGMEIADIAGQLERAAYGQPDPSIPSSIPPSTGHAAGTQPGGK